MRWFKWNRLDLHKHVGPYKISWRPLPPTPGLKIYKLRHIGQPPALSSDPIKIVANNTGQGAINIAFLFGASRILLLGFDMQPVAGRHNWHRLHKSNSTAPQRYKQVFIPSIERQSSLLKKNGVEVINCTANSALTCFPYIPLRDIDQPSRTLPGEGIATLSTAGPDTAIAAEPNPA